MKFTEIAARLTGVSTPIFGVSWNPPESERVIARRVIAHLEDRRILYNPTEMELPDHCVASVVDIRRLLSAELARVSENSPLREALRAMRGACRKFLDSIQGNERIVKFGVHAGHFANWEFNSAVGELRGVFGIHVARLATQYGVDVEDELASIFPIPDDGDET